MRTITDLRDHLFDTIEALRDPKNPMEIERANAISHAAQVVVNTAKVECAYLDVVGGVGTGFVPEEEPKIESTAKPKQLGNHR